MDSTDAGLEKALPALLSRPRAEEGVAAAAAALPLANAGTATSGTGGPAPPTRPLGELPGAGFLDKPGTGIE